MEANSSRPKKLQATDFSEFRRLIAAGKADVAVDALTSELSMCRPRSKYTVQVLVQLGLAALAAGNTEITGGSFRKAIALNPSLPQWAHWLAGSSNPRFIPFEAGNLAYCPIPKCGSTSLKELMARKMGLVDGMAESQFNAHQVFGPPQSTTYWAGLGDVRHLRRFVVIRDPIERFLSFYQHNIIEAKSLLKMSVRQELSGTGLSFRPTLNEFVTNLPVYASIYLTVRHHTTPQQTFIGSLSDFDSVYRLSEMSELKSALMGGQDAEEIPHSRKSAGKSRATLESLSSESRRKLLDLYAVDYELLSAYFSR